MKKLSEKYSQYGFGGLLRRSAIACLRLIGVKYESYYYLINRINTDTLSQKLSSIKSFNCTLLSLDDFRLGDADVFNTHKMTLIKERLENEHYKAYGVKMDNKLVYSCWISFNEFATSEKDNNVLLYPNEAMFVDDYCSIEYRGMGIHSYMNLYRLHEILKSGKNSAVVVILKGNRPAIKSQIKSGFEIAFKYRTLSVGKYFWSNFKSERNRFYANERK